MQKLHSWSEYLDSDSNTVRSAVDFLFPLGKWARGFFYLVVTGSKAVPAQKWYICKSMSVLICPAIPGCEVIIMLYIYIYIYIMVCLLLEVLQDLDENRKWKKEFIHLFFGQLCKIFQKAWWSVPVHSSTAHRLKYHHHGITSAKTVLWKSISPLFCLRREIDLLGRKPW